MIVIGVLEIYINGIIPLELKKTMLYFISSDTEIQLT